MNKNVLKLSLDFILLLGILLIMLPKMFGQALHEWAGLTMAALFICHLSVKYSQGSILGKIEVFQLELPDYESSRTGLLYKYSGADRKTS